MIISITESCHMGCSHCMDDARPCDKHMSMRTFQDAISFFNQFGGIECLITGGEPTDNPEWIKMLEYALEHAHGSTGTGIAHITLTTNAMNIANNRDIQTYLLLLMQRYPGKLNIQVTHVDQYYPHHVDLSQSFFHCGPVVVCNSIEAIYPMGRARDNKMPWQAKCSKCFNIRSATRSFRDLSKASIMLAMRGKFCTPQVSINGDVKLGESTLCPPCSSIYTGTEQLINDICNFHCSGCDMINKHLTPEQRKAIGE